MIFNILVIGVWMMGKICFCKDIIEWRLDVSGEKWIGIFYGLVIKIEFIGGDLLVCFLVRDWEIVK